MTQTPSEPRGSTRSPSDLLAQARRRGAQIRLRRRLTLTAGGMAIAIAAIVIPLSSLSGGSRQHLVEVASPTTGTSTATDQTTASTVAHATSTTSASHIAATTAPRTTSATAPAHPVTRTVTDANNGETISVPVGSTLIVQLSADNWTIDPSSQPSVLAVEGSPAQQPAAQCVPGGTCGTTTATFRAVKGGSAQVTDSRDYCGEAIRCLPATDSWEITVQVIR